MNGHILLVEDEAILREIVAAILQQGGMYEVTVAQNGEQAIELLLHHPHPSQPYDVVMSDIVMDGVNGIDVMRVARSLASPPEVILFTGQGSIETAIEAIRSGAFHYLLKPCRTPILLDCVASAMNKRHMELQRAKESEVVRSIMQLANTMQYEKQVSGATHEFEQKPPEPETNHVQQLGMLRVDTNRHIVWFNDKVVHLTKSEYEILAYLMSQAEKHSPYEKIVYHTRGVDVEQTEAYELLRQHVRNIRRKIDTRYLVSIHGGYMLVEPNKP